MSKEKKRKLCILGTAWTAKDAPFDNPDYDFWGVAHCLLLPQIKKMDAVFEIHLKDIWSKELHPNGKPIIHAANDFSCDIYTHEVDADLPRSIKFPREELKAKYKSIIPKSDHFYMTNSITWMVLLAVDSNKYDTIELYGIHLECDQEWTFERPCLEFWMGYAMGRGIKIDVAEAADVCRCSHEYGYAEIEGQRKKIQSRIEGFQTRMNDFTSQRTMLVNQLMSLEQELKIPTEERIKRVKEQKEMFDKEFEIATTKTPEEYESVIKNKVMERINITRSQLYEMEKRISSINGALEDSQYFLKQLNA